MLAYYISFLKTLSLKLNDNTLQFFFNEAENDFPLYTEAVKFFNNPDNMVRTAVRNLTLNVYKGVLFPRTICLFFLSSHHLLESLSLYAQWRMRE